MGGATSLRRRADEARPRRPRPVFHAAENSGDPVGFGEEGGVADGEGGAQAEPPQGADSRRRFGQEEERHGVRHEHPRQEDVAQLPARGFHQGCVIVSDKDPDHQAGAHEPADRENISINLTGPIFSASTMETDKRGCITVSWALFSN